MTSQFELRGQLLCLTALSFSEVLIREQRQCHEISPRREKEDGLFWDGTRLPFSVGSPGHDARSFSDYVKTISGQVDQTSTLASRPNTFPLYTRQFAKPKMIHRTI